MKPVFRIPVICGPSRIKRGYDLAVQFLGSQSPMHSPDTQLAAVAHERSDAGGGTLMWLICVALEQSSPEFGAE